MVATKFLWNFSQILTILIFWRKWFPVRSDYAIQSRQCSDEDVIESWWVWYCFSDDRWPTDIIVLLMLINSLYNWDSLASSMAEVASSRTTYTSKEILNDFALIINAIMTEKEVSKFLQGFLLSINLPL